jgi:D-alanyl-lipoteichoic acid acyltransferase DltB (MBOAT superfamily)
MLFSSWQFIFLFLPVTVAGFFLIPAQPAWSRKIWLLAASLYFYGHWKIEYIPLLALSIGARADASKLSGLLFF